MMEPAEILELTFYCEDLNEEVTIREWLTAILDRLWEEGEGFSGKRPLGNSDWAEAPVAMLIAEGVLDGEVRRETYTVTADGQVDETNDDFEVVTFEWKAYHSLMSRVIAEMAAKPEATTEYIEEKYDWWKTPQVVPYTHPTPWWETYTTDNTSDAPEFVRPTNAKP